MNARKNRRAFMKQCAALTALAAAAPAQAADDSEKGNAFICITCGTQFPRSKKPPKACAICEDERQYVGMNGQEWTTLPAMRGKYKNTIKEEEPGLYSISTEPKFGIGQRAFLLQTPHGNVLWDCIGMLDEPTTSASANWAASPTSPSRIRTTTRPWSNGAGPSAERPSTFTRPTGNG
jgi:hypothetical protein